MFKSIERKFKEKRGSYFVEAAFTLPVFILTVTALALIISIISICESISYQNAVEVRDIAVQTYFTPYANSISLCKKIENSVFDECDKLTDFKVLRINYLYQEDKIGIYDLIGISTEANFTVNNPIGIKGKINFKEKLLARGFNGCIQNAKPLSPSEFMSAGDSQLVVVFPKYGEKYHRKSCQVVTREDGEKCILTIQKEDAERRGYKPCLLCMGGGI